MSDVERYANDLKEISRYAREFKERVRNACGGSLEWGVEEVVKSYLSMFDRFCPFKVGDRVELRKAPIITGVGHGWWPCRHFLVRGVIGTVTERGYSDGQFVFYVVFDGETWVNDKGEEKPVSTKHSYGLGENILWPARPQKG